jgi:hypothetical protein
MGAPQEGLERLRAVGQESTTPPTAELEEYLPPMKSSM